MKRSNSAWTTSILRVVRSKHVVKGQLASLLVLN